jgi:hypothetical protein
MSDLTKLTVLLVTLAVMVLIAAGVGLAAAIVALGGGAGRHAAILRGGVAFGGMLALEIAAASLVVSVL